MAGKKGFLGRTMMQLVIGAKAHTAILLITHLWVFLASPLGVSHGHAQLRPIAVLHKAPDAATLPLTSNWMPIAIELAHTKATDLKVRLVGSKDGRFIDIVFPTGALNEEDRPLYQMEIPAPAASLSYQFIVHRPDGQLLTSEKFVVERSCVQNFKADGAGNPSDADFRKQVAELVSRAKILDRDRENLDAASKLLDDLKKIIPG